jgi:hypothetical protein
LTNSILTSVRVILPGRAARAKTLARSEALEDLLLAEAGEVESGQGLHDEVLRGVLDLQSTALHTLISS